MPDTQQFPEQFPAANCPTQNVSSAPLGNSDRAGQLRKNPFFSAAFLGQTGEAGWSGKGIRVWVEGEVFYTAPPVQLLNLDKSQCLSLSLFFLS